MCIDALFCKSQGSLQTIGTIKVSLLFLEDFLVVLAHIYFISGGKVLNTVSWTNSTHIYSDWRKVLDSSMQSTSIFSQLSCCLRRKTCVRLSSMHTFQIVYFDSNCLKIKEPSGGLVQKFYDLLAVAKTPILGNPTYVYLDKKCLNYGQNWQDGFINGLKNSQVVVLIISKTVWIQSNKVYKLLTFYGLQ